MSVDARPARSRTAAPTSRSARVMIAILSALALVTGLAPAATAQSVSSRLVDFTFEGNLNSGGSDLRPGGHVKLDLTATNTHGEPSLWPPSTAHRVLNTYGFTVPSGFTLRGSGGNDMINVGRHDQTNYFGGQPGGTISPNRSVAKGESRSGWLSFSIPTNAQGGSSHSFRVKAHIGTGGSWHGPASQILTVKLPAVATTTQAISVSPSTGRVGEDVTLATRVTANHGTNTPTGTVRFTVDGQTRTANVVSGVATTTTSFSTTGSKSVTATFVPSDSKQWSGSSRTGTVNIRTEATQTNLSLDPVEVLAGGTVQASASVNPAGAEGEIEFSAGNELVGVPVGADGSASVELPADTTGEMTVTATFIPADPSRFGGSSDTQSVEIDAEATQTELTLNPVEVIEGNTVRASARVTPADAEGEIEFVAGGRTVRPTNR